MGYSRVVESESGLRLVVGQHPRDLDDVPVECSPVGRKEKRKGDEFLVRRVGGGKNEARTHCTKSRSEKMNVLSCSTPQAMMSLAFSKEKA